MNGFKTESMDHSLHLFLIILIRALFAIMIKTFAFRLGIEH